jgi:hypothetical protein
MDRIRLTVESYGAGGMNKTAARMAIRRASLILRFEDGVDRQWIQWMGGSGSLLKVSEVPQ